ncbi:MAG: SDR family NAD(P)-dependent oxidoreductase [Planctomycetes bacterium]|nr:SDR family NAD(P)-dependent oxidoreductase [Planctomycetota bacterium]
MARIPAPTRALVTGASSGIGAALARRLAARGLEVWLAGRRKDLLDDEVAKIQGAGGRAHAFVLDVSQPDETVKRLVALDEESGGLDLVVANAGIGGSRGAKPLSACGWEDVRDFFVVNLLGATASLVPFIPRMLARGHGHLVGVSSVAADCPSPRYPPYGASKAGLTYFLEAADMELRPRGVAVTVVHPGFVRTPMTSDLKESLPFIVEVDDAARLIDNGIRRRVRFLRFPWATGAMARLGNSLPRALSAPLLRRMMLEH